MIRAALTLFLALIVTGCVHPVAVPPGGEMITYQNRPGFCMGACPTFRIEITSGGTGLLREYDGHGALTSIRRIRLPLDRYQAFARQLAPYRPVGESQFDATPPCVSMTSDLSDIAVEWRSDGRHDMLLYNVGCVTSQGTEMSEALMQAPRALGFSKLPILDEMWVATLRNEVGRNGSPDARKGNVH